MLLAVRERFQDRRKQPCLTLHRLQGDTVGVQGSDVLHGEARQPVGSDGRPCKVEGQAEAKVLGQERAGGSRSSR